MKRQVEQLISEYLSFFPCVVILGVRQTGKTTLLKRVMSVAEKNQRRSFFDLESRADYDQIERDPDLFLRTNPGPMAIDEAQRLPALFPALRVAIDKRRDQVGAYLISGSSSPELLREISESLAGRVGIIEISPFSFSETRGTTTPNLLRLFAHEIASESQTAQLMDAIGQFETNVGLGQINDYWFNGGYPEPWINKSPRFREVWRDQYLKTYIERDIARLFPGLNSLRFRRFVEILAGCSGTMINYSNIAKIIDVSQPTVKDYIRIAHGTYIWRNLPAYNKNVSKRVSKHPRGYFRDTGMLHHILQISSVKQLLSHPQMGFSWEALVIDEILRSLDAAGINYQPYYYRTAAGAEVDLVLEGKFGLIPFEIKYTQTVDRKYLRSLRDFIEEFNCPFGVVVNNDEKIRRYDNNIVGIPFAFLTSQN